MKPTYENLAPLKGGKITVSIKPVAASGSGLAQAFSPVQLNGGGQSVSIDDGQGSESGMWVHYIETRASVGFAASGQTWAASGPFSGCHIIVGKKDGSVFVAHIAQQSGSTADKDWAARGWKDEIWGRWKVPVPGEGNSNSVVFVDWSKGSSPSQISVVRVDIATKGMGGFDMKFDMSAKTFSPVPMDVFGVVHVVNPE